MSEAVDGSRITEILSTFSNERGNLIRLLQAMQSAFGYLPPETMIAVARHLKMSPSTVYSVVTFYAQFRLKPAGHHCVKVCWGTACHVKGAALVLEALEHKLGIKKGETTPDLEYSLEAEACFGSCALAPLVMVDDQFHSRVTPESASGLVGYPE
jgi:NADH-quinone oxidoreductase subunit E